MSVKKWVQEDQSLMCLPLSSYCFCFCVRRSLKCSKRTAWCSSLWRRKSKWRCAFDARQWQRERNRQSRVLSVSLLSLSFSHHMMSLCLIMWENEEEKVYVCDRERKKSRKAFQDMYVIKNKRKGNWVEQEAKNQMSVEGKEEREGRKRKEAGSGQRPESRER